MDQQKARELLTKYRLGRCSDEEAAWIEKWYTRTAAQSGKTIDPDHEQQQRSWEKIQEAITQQPVFEARLSSVRMLYLAASVAALLCVGFFFFYQNKNQLAAGNEMISLATRPGEVASYVLPDSSVVTMNGGSVISYSKAFTGNKRQVELKDGEVFFDVKHDPARPFIVNAGRTRTQVLGTAFSIRAYNFLENVQVIVSRGKVGVSNANGYPKAETEFLLPGDRVIVDNHSGDYLKVNADIEVATSWIKGVLNFDNEALSTIALLLEKKFNVPVSINGSALKTQRLTARFKADETLDEILATLGVAGNFSFKHTPHQVLISMNEH